MAQYRVLVEVITDDDVEDVRVIVNTLRGSTHAGILARNRVAAYREEAYDPQRHKIVTIEEV